MLKKFWTISLFALLLFSLLSLAASAALAEVSANPKSMIYHNSNCQHYGCKSCIVSFKSANEARQAGYRACKKCGG